jgi:serine/threonine protein kinase
MPPERLTASSPEGPESDIFSIGVVLYQMLSGELPISVGKDLVMTIHKQMHSEPTPLSDYLPDVPHDLCDVVHRAMRRQPADRPSASEMERELRTLVPELGALDGPSGSETLSGTFDREALTEAWNELEDNDV